MKKIIAISDSHGDTSNIFKIYDRILTCDFIIFLGDGIGDTSIIPQDKLIAVKGNCDGGYNSEKVVEIDGVKIFLTHGHEYHVKDTLLDLKYKAQEVKANLVLFGHTHESLIEEDCGVKFVNPGSIRGNFISSGSYAYIVIDNGKVYPVICEI